MIENKPLLEYGRVRARWKWWDSLFLTAVVLLTAFLIWSVITAPWGIFNVRVGLIR